MVNLMKQHASLRVKKRWSRKVVRDAKEEGRFKLPNPTYFVLIHPFSASFFILSFQITEYINFNR